jgi:hypothetical protein
VMILLDEPSIREVILFPQLLSFGSASGQDGAEATGEDAPA